MEERTQKLYRKFLSSADPKATQLQLQVRSHCAIAFRFVATDISLYLDEKLNGSNMSQIARVSLWHALV